jgi:hypothetical protein
MCFLNECLNDKVPILERRLVHRTLLNLNFNSELRDQTKLAGEAVFKLVFGEFS